MEVGTVIKRGDDFFFEIGNESRKSYKKRGNGSKKRWKFVLGLPEWEFSTGKKHFTPGKKSGKMTLPPQKNMPVTPLLSARL